MVGLVLVSHSAQIAEGLRELVSQVAGDGPVAAAGGDLAGGLGTSADRVREALVRLDNPDGIAVLADLGSAVLTAEMVIEGMAAELHGPAALCDGPFVEGALAAAVQAAIGAPLESVVAAAADAARVSKLGDRS